MNKSTHIKLGTRQSPLAMMQANLTKDLLESYHDDLVVEIVPIVTTGDIVLDKRLSEIGGKGLFTKELDIALLDGRCDIAVHSLKDVETILPVGTHIACVLPREDVRDVFISKDATSLVDMPQGATIGTTSLRRQALLLEQRPDFKVVVFRGNVQTRLRKLEQGEVDGTLLALAGLNRLGMQSVATEILCADAFTPAVGQGAIIVQCASNRDDINAMLTPINCEKSSVSVSVERAMLKALDGTCKTPVGGRAIIDGDTVTLHAFASTTDGGRTKRITKTSSIENAMEMGKSVGQELRQYMGDDFDRM